MRHKTESFGRDVIVSIRERVSKTMPTGGVAA